MMSFCNRVKEVLSLAFIYRALTSICTFLEILHTWVVDGKSFFTNCFLAFSVRVGCHCVFLMVLICSVIIIILDDQACHPNSNMYIHVWEMTVNGITIIVGFSFLYSYMRKKINFSFITFYWLLMVALFHIGLAVSHKTFNDSKIKLVHAINGALYFYLAGIVTTYIQRFNLNKKLKMEQLDGLEEWEDMELGDMFEYEREEMLGGFMFPFVDLSHHLQNHKEAAMLDKVGRGRW